MYNHAPEDYECPFCLHVRGIENEKVYVPNGHFENVYELPVHYGLDVQRIARRTAIAMKAVYGCDGVLTRQHNEPGGNQDVWHWHYHLHVTPRYDGDCFYISRREFMPAEERAWHDEKLKRRLAEAPETNSEGKEK